MDLKNVLRSVVLPQVGELLQLSWIWILTSHLTMGYVSESHLLAQMGVRLLTGIQVKLSMLTAMNFSSSKSLVTRYLSHREKAYELSQRLPSVGSKLQPKCVKLYLPKQNWNGSIKTLHISDCD